MPGSIKRLVCHEHLLLALIVASGLALRFLALLAFNHEPESDELVYRSMAHNLISGLGAVDHMENHAMYNVGYPLFVLAPALLLFGDDLVFVWIFNSFLGGAAIYLCYQIAKEIGAGIWGRLLAAAFLALYLPASVYSVYLAKENLMTPLMLGLVWFTLRLIKNPSYPLALGCGACLGLLALTGNAALSLMSVVVLATFILQASTARKLAIFLLIALSAISVSLPWVIRNALVVGSPVLNTNDGFNLYLGNNPAATGMFVSIADTPRGETWNELRKQGEVKASEILKNEAISWIKENPAEFVYLAAKKAIYFWKPPIHKEEGQSSKAESIVRTLWALQFILLSGAALATLFFRRLKKNISVRLLWVAILSYTAVHMIFYVIFRYREPIMPLLCILAALATESAFSNSSRHKKQFVDKNPI